MRQKTRINLIIVFFFSFIFIPLSVSSQLTIPRISPTISFSISPNIPKPFEKIDVSIQSYSIDLDLSSIDWFIDGERIAIGDGLVTVSTTLGDIGSETIVSVVIRPDEITEILEQISIRPSYVSILWEARTYTPPFYRGRALPSSSSEIFAEADVVFVRTDDQRVSKDDLVFTWKKNNSTLVNSSGRGKNKIKFKGPLLFREDILTVDVVSTDNQFKASSLTRIPSAEPYITLYKDDPLLGKMFHRAFANNDNIPGADITLAAIPFYTSIKNPADSHMAYSWKVNNQNIDTDPLDPFRIILRLTGGLIGTANVSLNISHEEDYLQSADKTWSLNISNEPATKNDPFFRSVN
jgi:hypothetical protein